jgi:cyclophilin family peptidyl-prolyl cis-trans isomerase
MKIKHLILALALFASACGNLGGSRNAANGEIKKGVAPVADSEVAVIEMETPAYGTMKIELYSNIAPKAVARFKELAREGYYNGIEFHRINDTVIQAGDGNTKPGATPRADGRQGDSGKPNVPAEFSDVPYDTGIVGAARLGNDVNSANSQFFIMLKREAQFDQKYTVFGKVIEGMNNARTISGVQPKQGERPVEPLRIKTIRIESK